MNLVSQNTMYSKIPTASRRSPVRSLSRSPSTSPGKSPGRSPLRSSFGDSPWKSPRQSPDRNASGDSPGKGKPQSPWSSEKSGIPTSPAFKRAQSPGGSPVLSRGRGVQKKVTLESPVQSVEKSPASGNMMNRTGNTSTQDSPQAAVRYMTEDLIKKVSKKDRLEAITNLNLTLAKDGGRKIKYIENLERMNRLTSLNLSCNMIEKIEKMEKLTRLRELNLSHNCLTKLDGLETLTTLQNLNVTGNSIEHIPPWFSKKLKALRCLRLARNQIHSLQELTKLRPLRDLTQLSVAESPVSQLPHYRSFLIFHLRTLSSLDGQEISTHERTTAHNRFAQEELERLEQQLEQQQKQYHSLKQEHNKSIGEIEDKTHKVKETEKKVKTKEQQLRDLQRELETKNDLLKRKTSELTKACQKHYELEQELAFYKIDHKFGELSRPHISDNEMVSEDDGSLGEESPYIGKGSFKKNEYIRQKQIHAHAQRGVAGVMGPDGYPVESSIPGLSYEEIKAREQANETLDRNLEEKHMAIERAQEKLHNLQSELHLTEDQLHQATEELHKIAEATPVRPLTEDDKQDIRNILGRKMDKVQHLRKTAHQIEHEMDMTREDLNQQEREVTKLRGKLKRMGSRDSLYSLVKKEVHDKEQQLEITAQQYSDLQQQLQGMIQNIAREADEVKKLEQDLREGQFQRSEEVREELEGIVQGLQAYLREVQDKAQRQKTEYDELVQEKLQLQEMLREADRDRLLMEQQSEEIANLRDKLGELEDSLQEQHDLNDSLQNHLEESRIREHQDADLTSRLQEAEQQLGHLKRTLKTTEKQAQRERDEYEKKMDADKKKLDHLKSRAWEANMKEGELHNLHKQLTSLQVTNAGLQDQIYDLQNKLQDEKSKAVNPDTLRRRLADITRALQSGGKVKDRVGYLGRRPGDEDQDPMDEVLEEMEDKLHKELDRSFKDVEKAKWEKDQAEAEVVQLKDQIVQVQDKEREMAEQAIQAMMEEERQESEKLKRMIESLKAELARERAKKERPPIPTRLLEPSPKSQGRRSTTVTGTTTATSVTDSSEEESSTIPSSEWSQKKREIYNTMNPEEQELFDELQQEIEELRKLLMMQGKDQDVVKKASQAAQTAAILRDMIEKRSSVTSDSGYNLKQTRIAGIGGGEGGKISKKGAGTSARTAQSQDPDTRKALKELDHAQREIAQLQEQLHRRNEIVKEELIRSDKNKNAVAAKQGEVDQLHAVLAEQKQELDELTEALDALTSQRPAQSRQEQMRSGPRDTDRTDPRALYQQRETRSVRRPGGQDPLRTEDLAHRPRDQQTREHFQEAPYRSPRKVPQGRPLPTFYSPEGQEIPFREEEYVTQADRPLTQPPGYPQNLPDGSIYPSDQRAAVGFQGSGPALQHQGHSVAPGSVPHPGHSVAPGYVPHPGQPGAPVFVDAHGNVIPGTQPAGGAPVASSRAVLAPSGAAGQSAIPVTESVLQGVPQGIPQGVPQHVPAYHVTPQGQVTGTYLPTTPVAGSQMGPALSAPNTPAAAQPMMMSTPVATAVGDMAGSGIKGILKKGSPEAVCLDDRLVCNVPEHHDLEDYITQLQKKLKKYKSRLRNHEDTTLEDSRRVLFEEDAEKRTISRLQSELEDRRRDLESLDLAIERQKAHLIKMNKKEEKLRRKRNAAKEELSKVSGHKRTSRRQRQAFLDGSVDLELDDSDFEYDFQPYASHNRKEHIQNEILCLEETLAKRRAELRAADKLLTDCEMDLSGARHEAKDTIFQFKMARDGYRSVVQDTEEIERRARETGAVLIRAEEELEKVKLETKQLRDKREQHETMIKEIQKVVTSKDAEFQNLELKIKQSTDRLQKIQYELRSSEGQQREHLSLIQEADRVISEKKRELDHLLKQISTEHQELEHMDKQIGRERAELEVTEGSVRKRRTELQDLQQELDIQIELKRQEVKDLDRQLVDRHQDRRRYEQELHQVRQDIEHEEAVLQNVARLTSQHKEELRNAETALRTCTEQLGDVRNEHAQKSERLTEIQTQIHQGEAELDRVKGEGRKRAAELEMLQRKVTAVRDDVDGVQNQKRALEASVAGLRKEKVTLEENTRELHRTVADLQRSKGQLETDVDASQRQLSSLERELSKVEEILNSMNSERSGLDREVDGLKSNIKDGRSELLDVQSSLQSAQTTSKRLDQREEDRRSQSESRYSGLEGRLNNLAQDITKREKEKDHLNAALERSCQEQHELHRQLKQEREEMGLRMRCLEANSRGLQQEVDDRNKELLHLRKKTANEIADLEGVAQTHCARANRLSDELSYLRAEYLEVKRQLDSQQEIAEREKRLEESIKDLKSDIKYEVTDRILDQEKSKQDTLNELDQLQDQKQSLSDHLSSLKQNLSLIRSQDSGFHTSTDSLKESVIEHQTFLKNQLESKMARQAEILKAQREISQVNLLNLQRKLSSVEQVFSQGDAVNLTPVSDQVDNKLQHSPSLEQNESKHQSPDRDSSSQESSSSKDVPRRAYSPHRYSNSRNSRSSPDIQVAERDSSS